MEQYPEIPFTIVPGSAGCIALARSGSYLYTAGGDRLSVYDISRPDHPKLCWRRSGFGNGRQLAAAHGRLYLTAREFGLWILDLADPARPRVISRFDTVELATGIAVAENTVFVTERIYGVEIIDVTDPARPRHLSLIRTPEAQSAAYSDGQLYVGDWGVGRLTVIDVRDRSNPQQLSTAELGGFGDGVAVYGDLCCAATGLNAKSGSETELAGNGHGLDIFRLDENRLPHHLARLNFPLLQVKTNDFWTVRLAGTEAFVADTHNGVFRVDLADPAHPRCTGRMVLPDIIRMDGRATGRVRISVPDCAGDCTVGDGVLYVAAQKSGLLVTSLPGLKPNPPESSKVPLLTGRRAPAAIDGLARVECGGQVRRLALDGDTLYAACSHAGLQIWHLDGENVKPVGTLPVRCSYDVAVRDGKLYSAEGLDGVAVYDLAVFPPKELGRYKRPNRIFQLCRLTTDNRFALCSCRDGILRILDLTDLSAIRLAYHHLHGGLLYGDSFPEGDRNGLVPVIWPLLRPRLVRSLRPPPETVPGRPAGAFRRPERRNHLLERRLPDEWEGRLLPDSGPGRDSAGTHLLRRRSDPGRSDRRNRRNRLLRPAQR
ncbi:MAG: hypothetical protein L6W00_16370 [Lentisphaeria bacterium]|nr:MAG: hypothetical protein L6W00_16370 [Lentisphaeria bacterium]